jgi:energy-coupling factor transport system permease protein
VLAVVTSIVAVLLGGVVGPTVLIVVAVLLPAAAAGVLRRVLRTTLLLALPLALSAAIVNLFFFPGGTTVLVAIGPITATAEGAVFAAGIVMRVLAIAAALTLFYSTTRTSELVVDLERRGVSPRLAFVTNSAVSTVPAMVERAATITAAQRARGLDTEGSPWRRIRGIVPLVGPTILGAINEVEERTMALEARGFTRPGRRTLLWHPADSPRQRVARWLILLAIPVALVLPAIGVRLP